jgi:hypothetical protein
MAKSKFDITDLKALAIESFTRLGGIEEYVKWGRTHRTLYYTNSLPKLLAQPLVQNVAVNVINNGEAARRKLEDAFLHLIESRKFDSVDPAAFINNERVEPLTIEHQAAVARPATPDPTHQAASDDATSPQKGPLFSRGGVATTSTETSPGGGQNKKSHYSKPFSSVAGACAGAAVGEGSDDSLSTTARFLNWSARGGGRMP